MRIYRIYALELLFQCSGEVNKSLQKSLLNPVLTTFSEALVAALLVPDDSHSSDAGLKTQVGELSLQ